MEKIQKIQKFMDKSGKWHKYLVTYTVEAGTLTMEREDWEKIQQIIGGTK